MLLLVFMLLMVPSLAGAGDRKPKGAFGLFIENDVFALSDGGYTNGVDLVWLSPVLDGGRGRAPRWADGLSRSLARSFKPGARRFVSFSLAQRMYTPEDVTRSDLIEDDRPYAGVMTAGLGFHFRSGNSMDTLRFEAGIVGPHSYAGDIQKLLHRAFHWTFPEGWAHQLKDELVLGLEFDRRQRLRAASGAAGLDWELIGHLGGSLSNLLTCFGGGLEVRAGWNLPWDLGTSLLGPASDAAVLLVDPEPLPPRPVRLGFHVFIAVETRIVARDLLLDGNTFRTSHRVEKLPLTADLAAGLALKYKRLKACLSYTYQTQRFYGQHLRPVFGSLDLALLF
jgi:lipid A 3-O-deacylase